MRQQKQRKRLMILWMILVCVVGLILSILSMSSSTQKKKSGSYYDLNAFGYKNGLMTFSDDHYSTQTGIDVSSHQGSIDWDAVKKSDITFAMIRCGYRGASEGALYEDRAFATNIKAAQAAGLKVGVYWFSSAITVAEAKEEADYVLSLVSAYDLDLPIAFDMERLEGQTSRIDDLTKQEKTKIANAFVSRLKKKGYKTLVYGNASWLSNDIQVNKIDSDIWLASYSDTLTYKKAFTMWQYTQKGSVDGISGSVDIDLYIQEK
ncbi:glycoside hydrolase family 25 protein [Absicoccus intestinalis]|uniref:Glycoside hydrolase family 25 protein n=1 Tax=Absicoccus intestinalis TaxID=2926319 RepID=A0ABU4WL81_9FIRM|nr:glycoside hydrolase family 25 protein [Absicoccus sp. CLA-KB-P134]MDX8416831.1 glycoside hydrolase family 25 protein [Absicoccus sp. CLA-KB-P134]